LSQLADQLTRAGCRVERCTPPGFDFAAAVETDHEIQMGAFMARETPLHLPRFVFRQLAKRIGENNPALRGGLRGAGITLAQYGAALARRARFIRILEQFLANYDAWLCPVAPVPAFVHTPVNNLLEQIRATVDMDGQPIPYFNATAIYTSVFNLTGNPVVVIPLARSKDGLPIGIQLVGRRWNDMALLNTAEALMELTGVFCPPPGY
jgi:amidase